MTDDEFKVLLVEDEPLLQHVFQQQMQKLGQDVHTTVANGLDAIEHVLTNDYHLVFMDVRLPVLDGLSATERIRKAEREKGRYTPIVGLTAFAHRGKCIRVGMDDFLQKPVILEELRDVLSKWRETKEVDRSQDLVKTSQSDGGIIVHPEEFDKISERLTNIRDRISKLRTTFDLDRTEHKKRESDA